MRPSIASRRLEEYQAEEASLTLRLLTTIHEAIVNTKNQEITIKKYDGKYILRKSGITHDDVSIEWQMMDSCHLLKIYDSIIKTMNT